MNFPYFLMFYLLLIFSLMVQVSMSSWMFVWIGLEMNMLCIIPLLVSGFKNMNDSAVKYFIVQVFGSVILLIGFFLSTMSLLGYYYYDVIGFVFWMSLMLKIGAAPFHFWYLSVLENLSWMNIFLMMTIQKFGLLFIMGYLLSLEVYLVFSIILSVFVGGVGGLNQVMMRSLFIYSSIGHVGWMIVAILLSDDVWIVYYSFYFVMMMMFSILFYKKGVVYINQMYNYFSKLEKWMILLGMLSLGGFPPFSGFFPKIVILNILMKSGEWLLVLMMLMGMLVGLYYYVRLVYISMMVWTLSSVWVLNAKTNVVLSVWFNMIMMIMLFIIPIGMIWF
uniref:NADH-ubiquinone oxidoreductase chain 2 n=1 Tax=Epiperipatus biolleyi TaxID=172520 RepID=A3QU21_EPIBI|nr:NADH dehydrogenase subunit 2 [Epiperipatus biolleyi]ABF93292.1 NADH dehydrogenase subunit 2 [Epiperipatus biolleyi]